MLQKIQEQEKYSLICLRVTSAVKKFLPSSHALKSDPSHYRSSELRLSGLIFWESTTETTGPQWPSSMLMTPDSMSPSLVTWTLPTTAGNSASAFLMELTSVRLVIQNNRDRNKLKVSLEKSDILPLINMVWPILFGRKQGNIKTMMEPFKLFPPD